MAWNTPGGNGNDRGRGTGGNGRNPWPPRRGTGGGILDRLPDPLRGMFDGGGGAWRWIAIVLLLWLVFSSMVLVTEQQRGVVLRFGDYARTMQPGLNFKWPWPVERVTKVNATEIKTFSDNVPVLTSDENIVQVEINVQYRIADPEKFLFGTRDGDGLDLLRRALGARLGLRRVAGELVLPGDAGRLRARLHDLGAVRSEQHDDDGWRLQLDLAEADASRLAAQDFGAPLRPLIDGTSVGSPSVEGGP